MPLTGNDNDQPCKGADDKGIDKRTKHGDQPLSDRLVDLGRRMGHRRRTQPGLVGKDSPGDALLKCNPDGGPGKAAGRGNRREGIPEDHFKGGKNHVIRDHQNDQRRANVDNTHKRNETAGHTADSLDAADDNQADQHGDRQTESEPDIQA